MDDVDQGRRSGFLVFAALVANVFLVTFAVEAAISLVDDLVLLSPENSAFYMGRNWLAFAVFVLTIAALFLVIFVPQLPKLVLLPPLLAVIWMIFGAPPLSWSLSDRSTWVPIDAVQLAAVAAAFGILKWTTGHWLLAASRLPRKGHLVLRTLVAVPVALVVVLALSSAALLSGVAFYIEDLTKGYLHFASSGIEVRETVMRKDNKVVHLVATVHLADPKFYRDLYATVPKDALILAEGVTDREGRLTSGLSYGQAAQALGLETQDVFEKLLGPAAEDNEDKPATTTGPKPDQAPKPPAAAENAATAKRPFVVRADVDISELSDPTIRFIRTVGEVYGSKTFSEAMSRLSAVGNQFTDEEVKAVMEELIAKRNAKALAALDKRLPTYNTVFIPWGAQHMPGFEAALKERGFRIESQRMIPLAQYQTIFDALTARTARQADAGVPLLRLAALRNGAP